MDRRHILAIILATGLWRSAAAGDLLAVPAWVPVEPGTEVAYQVTSNSPLMEDSASPLVRVVTVIHDSESYQATLFFYANPREFVDMKLSYDGKKLMLFNQWTEFVVDDFPAAPRKGHKSPVVCTSLIYDQVIFRGHVSIESTGAKYASGEKRIQDATAVAVDLHSEDQRSVRVDALLGAPFGVLRSTVTAFDRGEPRGGPMILEMKVPRRPF